MSAKTPKSYLEAVLFFNYSGETPDPFIGYNRDGLEWLFLEEQYENTQKLDYDLLKNAVYVATFLLQCVYLRWGSRNKIQPSTLLSIPITALLHFISFLLIPEFFHAHPRHITTPNGLKYLESPVWTAQLALDQFCSNFYVLVVWSIMFLRVRAQENLTYHRIALCASIVVSWVFSLVSVYVCEKTMVFIGIEFEFKGADGLLGTLIHQGIYLFSTATILHWVWIRRIWKNPFRSPLDVYDGLLGFSVLHGTIQFLHDAAHFFSWSDPMALKFWKIYTSNFAAINCAPLIILPVFLMMSNGNRQYINADQKRNRKPRETMVSLDSNFHETF